MSQEKLGKYGILEEILFSPLYYDETFQLLKNSRGKPQRFCLFHDYFNRPGVAGAVLQSPLLLITRLIL